MGSSLLCFRCELAYRRRFVLGPTLFLVFIRDMGVGIESSLAHYADDSTLHRVIQRKQDRRTAATTLNDDLCALQVWADTWCAQFNASKTHVLTISRARDATLCHPPLFLGNQRLQEVDHLTIIGLLMNQRLSWGPHVRKLATRCSQQTPYAGPASFCPSPRWLQPTKGSSAPAWNTFPQFGAAVPTLTYSYCFVCRTEPSDYAASTTPQHAPY